MTTEEKTSQGHNGSKKSNVDDDLIFFLLFTLCFCII